MVRIIQCRYFTYLYKEFMLWTISAPSTSENSVITIYRCNQIKEPIIETLEQFRKKSSLKFCSSRTTITTKICFNWDSSEKKTEPMEYIYTYIYEYILWELAHIIMKTKKSMMGKLETQENQWCNSVWAQWSKIQGIK